MFDWCSPTCGIFIDRAEIASHLIIAAMHNRASVNSVAIRTVSVVYNHIFDAALQCQKMGSIFFLESWISTVKKRFKKFSVLSTN